MNTDVTLTYRKTELLDIPLEHLQPGAYQPRQEFSKEGLESLAQTIRQIGILEPLAVRKLQGKSTHYEIIAGERRFRAAKLAGLPTVPCIVGRYSDEESAQCALIENTCREALNPISKARAMHRLIKEFQYTHDQLAAILGVSRCMVTNQLRLLKLDPRIQVWIYQGHLSEGHGKVLAGVPYEEQYLLAHKSIRRSWSVSLLGKEVESTQNKPTKKSQQPDISSTVEHKKLKELESMLSAKLGTPVLMKIKPDSSGYFRIDFTQAESMEAIIKQLTD